MLSCVTGQPPPDVVVDGVQVHRRDAPFVRGSVRSLRSLRAAERLATALACRRHMRALGRFDVVEAPDYMAEGLFVTGAPLVAHLHTPVQLTVRYAGSFDWNQRAAGWLERLAIRRSNLVTAPSRLWCRRSATSDGPHTARQIIAHPVDLHQWEGVCSASETSPWS